VHTIPTTATIIGGIGAALLASAAILDGLSDGDMRVMGAVLVLTALGTTALRRIARPTTAAYELGHSEGYQQGYRDGRKVGRPVVVKLPTTCRENAAAHGCGATSSHGQPIPTPPGLNHAH
jgi:hypothetical protein